MELKIWVNKKGKINIFHIYGHITVVMMVMMMIIIIVVVIVIGIIIVVKLKYSFSTYKVCIILCIVI